MTVSENARRMTRMRHLTYTYLEENPEQAIRDHNILIWLAPLVGVEAAGSGFVPITT